MLNPEVQGKSEIGRPDRCFKLPRPAILLPKIRLCSVVFDFPRTSGITASNREPSNNDDIRDNIQLSRKHQRAVAGKPNNDPSWSSSHVEYTTTVSLRTSYRNFQRPRLRTTGSSPALTINLDRKPRVLGDAPSILRTDT